jgi:hypothetical protein
VVLTVNEALVDRLVLLGAPPHKVVLVPNSPSSRTSIRQPAGPPIHGRRRPAVHLAGALTPIYELDVTLMPSSACGRCPDLDVRYALYGRGDHEASSGSGHRARPADRVDPGRIPLESVSAAIAAADIGSRRLIATATPI